MIYHALAVFSSLLLASTCMSHPAPEPQSSSCLNLHNACEIVDAAGNGSVVDVLGTCCEPLTCSGDFGIWPAIIVRASYSSTTYYT